MANFALFTWPFIAIVLFAWLGRERGLIWSVLIGYLFLPEALVFELPGLPDYDKLLAISLGAVLGSILFRHKRSFPQELILPPPRDIIGEISEIWADILEIEEGQDVPRDKGFVALGGANSQMRLAVRRVTDIGVEPKVARSIYDGASINDLAEFIPIEGPRRLGSPSLTVVSYTLFGGLIFATIMTMLTNPDEIVADFSVRPGLSFRDVISMIAEPVIVMVPFFLALTFLRSQRQQMEVFRAIVIAGVGYACLAAFEARMSPQLNVWVYGYFQHSWIQHLRNGFRPIVFLQHGLWLGFFLLTAAVAAMAMFRHTEGKDRYLYLFAGIWILGVLAISRNLGASMLAALFVPLVLFAPRYIQLRVTAAVAILFLIYPAVRLSPQLPMERFLEFVASISPERAQSLQFRLDNEYSLLARAAERPLFGWGGWDRWRVFDGLGRDITVADGMWIITLGERGWIGYICFFMLLILPLLYLLRAVRRKESSHVVPAMALVIAANLIYMIPNSALGPVDWLIVGTIAGFVRWHLIEVRAEEVDWGTEAPPRAASVYTRFEHKHSRPQMPSG